MIQGILVVVLVYLKVMVFTHIHWHTHINSCPLPVFLARGRHTYGSDSDAGWSETFQTAGGRERDPKTVHLMGGMGKLYGKETI